MATDWLSPTSGSWSWNGVGHGSVTNMGNSYDQDWDTYADVNLGGTGSLPASYVTLYWDYDSVVADRIKVKGSGNYFFSWGCSLSVLVDGVWHSLAANYWNQWGSVLTFPEGVVTQAKMKMGHYDVGNHFYKIYEVGLGFKADFSGTPTEGCDSLEVEFTNSSYPEGSASVDWDFGDGSTSGSWSPTHTYTDLGFHAVELAITWPELGLTETKTDYIYVGGYLPDFEATPLTGCAPLMVEFTGSWPGPSELIYDSDYEWDFGYDDLVWWGQTGLNTFCSTGSYDVTLTIDDGVCETSVTKEAYIEAALQCPTCNTYQSTDEDLAWSRGASTDILGDTVVCVFSHRYPNAVRFVRSDDRGVTWSEPVTFVSDSCKWMGHRPVVRIVNTNTIYVTWGEKNNYNWDVIYFTKSTDGGETFETPVKIVDDQELSCYYTRPAFFTVDYNGYILVMWNYSNLCFASSEDGGATWTNKQSIASLGSSYEGYICVDSEDTIFLICPSGVYVYLWVSTDNGATWGAAQTVVHDTDTSHETARITASGTDLYAAWLMQAYDAVEDEYYYHVESSRSTNHGVTWTSPVRVDDVPDVSNNYLYFDDGTLGIGFVDSRLAIAWLPEWGYAPPLHIKMSSDNGETWGDLYKSCATWYNYSFEIAFGSDYVVAGWTGTRDTDAWTDFLYVTVCDWGYSARTFFFLA